MSDLYRIVGYDRLPDYAQTKREIDGLIERKTLVPVERCEHGEIDPHPVSVREFLSGIETTTMCPGAGLEDDDESGAGGG